MRTFIDEFGRKQSTFFCNIMKTKKFSMLNIPPPHLPTMFKIFNMTPVESKLVVRLTPQKLNIFKYSALYIKYYILSCFHSTVKIKGKQIYYCVFIEIAPKFHKTANYL